MSEKCDGSGRLWMEWIGDQRPVCEYKSPCPGCPNCRKPVPLMIRDGDTVEWFPDD